MKTFTTILILTVLSSCITEKHRQRICNACAVTTNSKDSIYEHVIHDTITFPPVEGPIQYLENPCKILCDSLGHLKPFIRIEKHNGITSTIESKDDNISFKCAADSLQRYIDHIQKDSYHKTDSAYEKRIPCENERTRFDGFTFWWFWITLVLLILFIVIKIFFKK